MAKGCRNEFPYFGASYPDAHCINGYLWDLDYVEDGQFTFGGDEPYPFCNTEEWLDRVVGTLFESKADALEWRDKIANRWDCKPMEE